MVVLRCTQKLLKRLGPAQDVTGASTAKLGDWSANLLAVGQRRFVLLVSGSTRLPVLVRAHDVRNLPRHFPWLLAPVLKGLRVPAIVIERDNPDADLVDVSLRLSETPISTVAWESPASLVHTILR